MLDHNVSLANILAGIEGVLKLEYTEEAKVEEIIEAALSRLEDTFGFPFDKDVYTLQSESQLSADGVDSLLKEVTSCLEQMAFYIQLKLYHKNHSLTLADVNYLGYAKPQLLTALRYLQDAKEYKARREEIIKPLYNTLNNLNMCNNKRLFIIMLMLDRLGIGEGVAVYAQLLYLGGLIV